MTEEKKDEAKKMSLREFLELIPPYEYIEITDIAKNPAYCDISEPEIKTYCDSDECLDIRYFDCKDTYSNLDGRAAIVGLRYCCRHCLKGEKWFSLLAFKNKDKRSGGALKLGEWPIFGDPIPSKVFSLIGDDRDLFLKGKRAEDQGLGIGAFAYYRRVVENQWQRLLGEIIKVSTHLKKPAEKIEILEKAQKENQFNKAVTSIKDAIPESLLIDGHHNPLTLLHDTLSKGVHELSDDECLDRAKSIRLILFELSERLGNAMKEHSELKKALTKLFGSNKNDGTDSEHKEDSSNLNS
ncbi:MAG: hypothetical protein JW837_13390 [Sedimentisphaerales bacterium]|nr:hypothetical protein [Sedimentisphaerales bacterium]